MRIVVDSSVHQDQRWYPLLDAIALLVETERHVFAAEELLELSESGWVESRSGDLKAFLAKSEVAQSYSSLHKSRVVIDMQAPVGGRFEPPGTTRVLPIESLMFLCTPFQIIVENEEFDGAFLLWMARALGMMQFVSAYRSGRFVFRHAGGKGSLVRSARIFSQGVWARDDGRYSKSLKMWLAVLLDNDAQHAGDTPNQDLVNRVQPHALFVHLLGRRAIESYIPHDVLVEHDGTRRHMFGCLFRLSDVQRRYFHMKQGFKIRREVVDRLTYTASPEVPAEVKQLYQDVSANDWLALAPGFGSGLSSIFTDINMRPTNTHLLKDVSDKAELTEILNKIMRAI